MYQVSGVILSQAVPVKSTGTAYHLISIKAPDIASDSRPGQYVMLKCGELSTLRRPLSIHSVDPAEGTIDLLFAPTGSGTQWLATQKKGAVLDILGPLGTGFSLQPSQSGMLIVAGGIGIAPLKYLAATALASGCRVTLLLGAKTAGMLYPARMLPADLGLIKVTEDGSAGQCGTVTSMIARYIGSADQVFACGPLAMYREIARLQNRHKWPQEIQVSLEVRMGCGFGVCFGCSIKTRRGMKRICRDGPVFNIKDIIWQEVNL